MSPSSIDIAGLHLLAPTARGRAPVFPTDALGLWHGHGVSRWHRNGARNLTPLGANKGIRRGNMIPWFYTDKRFKPRSQEMAKRPR